MDFAKSVSTSDNKLKTVSIIEDDHNIRTQIVRYMEIVDDVKMGFVADSVEHYFELVKEFPEQKSDLLLLDIGLPGMTGLEALPKLKKQNPELDIIMLTTYEEEKKVLKAMCSGAVAYLSKKTSLKEIVEAIRIVHNGGSYMSPLIARDIFKYMVRSNSPVESKILTKRQNEILASMADGKSYTFIAKELFLSPETVRSHIKNIYKALHVNNKTEAITKYLKGNI